MGLKNLFQRKEDWGEPFGTQAANQSSFLREDKPPHSLVDLEPLPSFLTKTPLGTPCEETVEWKPMAEIPLKGQNKVRDTGVSLQRQVAEPARGVPKRFKEKTGQGKKAVKSNQGARAYGFIYRWVYEEVRLSMSKMSIASLVFGLLFLGTLFFIIGFLAAVATIGSSPGGGGNTPSTWQASNTHDEKKAGGKGFGRVVSNIGGGIVGKVVGHQIGTLGKVVGTSSVVPKSLQPFARYGMGKAGGEIRRDVRQVNPFVPQKRGRGPSQQPYSPHQPEGPQQYAPPYGIQGGSVQNQFQGQPQGQSQGQLQGQAYGPPSAAVGYYQPAATPPGGYNQGYGPPQQQQMMQQSYYPQPVPVQQQAYQQPLMQPMMPQQQMMPNPQYQQQMPPQQANYR
jgi:hypothetical protein